MPFSYSNAASIPSAVTPIDRTSSITTGGTAQVLMAANTSRGGWWLLNTSSSVLFVSEMGTATTSSIPVNPGQEYIPPATTTGAVSIIGSVTGQTFQCREWNGVPAANLTLNGGLSSSGPLTTANSLSVVSASNFTTDVENRYTANIAGTGYAVGERLIQVVRNVGGVYQEVWFNTDQKTILATAPTQALIASNLGYSNLYARPEWKSRRKWIVGNAVNALAASPYTYFAIRNTNTFPVRVVSLNLQLISTTAPAVNTSTWNVNTIIYMYTGATSFTGGFTGSTFTVPGYVGDGTIIQNCGATAIGGTANNLGGCVLPIVSYIEGATAGITSKTPVQLSQAWAEGLIIPAGGALVIQNNNGFSGPIANSYSCGTAVLVDEL